MDSWDSADVCHWLVSIGLRKYVDTFHDNQIVGADLANLRHEDLRFALGICSFNDRKHLLLSISESRDGPALPVPSFQLQPNNCYDPLGLAYLSPPSELYPNISGNNDISADFIYPIYGESEYDSDELERELSHWDSSDIESEPSGETSSLDYQKSRSITKKNNNYSNIVSTQSGGLFVDEQLVMEIVSSQIDHFQQLWEERVLPKFQKRKRQLWFRLQRYRLDIRMELADLTSKRINPLIETIKKSATSESDVRRLCSAMRESIYLKCELEWKLKLCGLRDPPEPDPDMPVISKSRKKTDGNSKIKSDDEAYYTDDFIATDDDEDEIVDDVELSAEESGNEPYDSSERQSNHDDEISNESTGDSDMEISPALTTNGTPEIVSRNIKSTENSLKLESDSQMKNSDSEGDFLAIPDVSQAELDLFKDIQSDVDISTSKPRSAARANFHEENDSGNDEKFERKSRNAVARSYTRISTTTKAASTSIPPAELHKSPGLDFSHTIEIKHLMHIHSLIPSSLSNLYLWNSQLSCYLFHPLIYAAVGGKLNQQLSHRQRLNSNSEPSIYSFTEVSRLWFEFQTFQRDLNGLDDVVKKKHFAGTLTIRNSFAFFALVLESAFINGPKQPISLKSVASWLKVDPLPENQLSEEEVAFLRFDRFLSREPPKHEMTTQSNRLSTIDQSSKTAVLCTNNQPAPPQTNVLTITNSKSLPKDNLKALVHNIAITRNLELEKQENYQRKATNGPKRALPDSNDKSPKKSRQAVSKYRGLFQRIEEERLRPSSNDGQVLVNLNRVSTMPKVYFPSFMIGVLKDHQIDGVRFIWNCLCENGENEGTGGCILAHSMGLGKTLQVIAFVLILYRTLKFQKAALPQSLIMPVLKVLIIVPASLLDNWLAEIERWIPSAEASTIGQVIALRGDNTRRVSDVEKWLKTGGLCLTTFETYRLLTDDRDSSYLMWRRALQSPGPDLVICDEAHRIKNPLSIISTSLQKISTKNRICLTGYPLQNNLEEYYTMVNFVRPGCLGELQDFRIRFAIPITSAFTNESSLEETKFGKKRLYVLHKLLDPFVFRLDIKDPRNNTGYSKLLVKHYAPVVTTRSYDFVIKLRISPLQKELYQAALNRFDSGNSHLLERIAELRHIINNGARAPSSKANKKEKEKRPIGGIAVDGSRTHPIILESETIDDITEDSNEEDSYHFLGSSVFSEIIKKYSDSKRLRWCPKLKIALRIIEITATMREKVLVFSEFLSTLDLIEEYLKERRYPIQFVRLDGSVPPPKRKLIVDGFNSNPLVTVFLISIRAGGLGLNCQSANRVILFDSNFNPCHNEQAIARAYRCGQTKDVFIYRLCIYDSIDDILYRKAKQKNDLSKLIIDKKRAVDLDVSKRDMKLYFHEPRSDAPAVSQSEISHFLNFDSILKTLCYEFSSDIIELASSSEFGDLDIDLGKEDLEEADKLFLAEKILYSERVKGNHMVGSGDHPTKRHSNPIGSVSTSVTASLPPLRVISYLPPSMQQNADTNDPNPALSSQGTTVSTASNSKI